VRATRAVKCCEYAVGALWELDVSVVRAVSVVSVLQLP
jgi:hypothetical protein